MCVDPPYSCAHGPTARRRRTNFGGTLLKVCYSSSPFIVVTAYSRRHIDSLRRPRTNARAPLLYCSKGAARRPFTVFSASKPTNFGGTRKMRIYGGRVHPFTRPPLWRRHGAFSYIDGRGSLTVTTVQRQYYIVTRSRDRVGIPLFRGLDRPTGVHLDGSRLRSHLRLRTSSTYLLPVL